MTTPEHWTTQEVRLLQKVLETLPDKAEAENPQCALVRLCAYSADRLRDQLQKEGCDTAWKVLPLAPVSDMLMPALAFMNYTQCEIERAQCAGSTLGFAVLTVRAPGTLKSERAGMRCTEEQGQPNTGTFLYNLARTVQQHVPSFVRLGKLDEYSLGILYPHANVLRLQAMLEQVFDDIRAALAEESVGVPVAGLTLFVPSDPDAASVRSAMHLLERARLALERVHQSGGIYVFRTQAAENPTLVQAAEKQFLFFGKVSNE